ncbi:MAG: hypothetical protein AAB327_03535 [Actinomycetota bacterium]
MKAGTTTQFAAAARLLASETQRYGLDAPSFRSPPRIIGFDRTIRRRHAGGVVAVALRGRPFVAVLSDMIEGVIVVNRLQTPESDRVRTALWAMLSIHGHLDGETHRDTQVGTIKHQGLQTRVA